jgi:hypothetical protein
LNSRTLAVVFVALLLANCLALPAGAGAVVASGFDVVGATWGSSANPVEVGAGSQDVPLTVTAQYFFSNTATGMVATLSLPQGFTDLNGGSSPSAYISGAVASGTVVQFTFYLDVASGAPVGTYSFPIEFQWGAQTATTSVSVVQDSTVMVHMNGKVKLVFQAVKTSVVPG